MREKHLENLHYSFRGAGLSAFALFGRPKVFVLVHKFAENRVDSLDLFADGFGANANLDGQAFYKRMFLTLYNLNQGHEWGHSGLSLFARHAFELRPGWQRWQSIVDNARATCGA